MLKSKPKQTAQNNSKGTAQKNITANHKNGKATSKLHTLNTMTKETIDGIVDIVKNRHEGFDDFDINDNVLSDFTAFDNCLTFDPELAKEVGDYINDAIDNIMSTVVCSSGTAKLEVFRWVRSRLATAYAINKAYEDWMNYDDDSTGLWEDTCDGVAEALYSVYPLKCSFE